MAHGGLLAGKAFKEMGVDCVFTLSGGHIMAIYEGCVEEGIQIIDVRHEQATTHAADAWARLNPGKVFPTLHRCAELGRVHVHRGARPFPDLPRF